MNLINCPNPIEDESFGGYILRLTEENFYPNNKYIYNFLITNQRVSKNPYKINAEMDMSTLSDLTKLPERLFWLMLTPYKNLENILDIKKIREEYRTNTRAKYFSTNNRVCVECLKKHSYIKKIWDIHLNTVCLEHECLLTDECPNCRKKLKYSRSKINYCQCGYNLCEIQSIVVPTLETKLTKLILHTCGYIDCEFEGNNPLLTSNLSQIVDSILTVSSSLFKQTYISSPKNSIIDLHKTFVLAFNMFENWPNGYYEMLHNKQNEIKVVKSLGVGRFGNYYQVIFGKRGRGRDLNILRKGFEDYLISYWDAGNVTLLKNIQKSDSNYKYVTKSKAAEILNMSEETISGLLDAGHLKGIARKKRLYLIETDSIELFKKTEPLVAPKKFVSYENLGDYVTKIRQGYI